MLVSLTTRSRAFLKILFGAEADKTSAPPAGPLEIMAVANSLLRQGQYSEFAPLYPQAAQAALDHNNIKDFLWFTASAMVTKSARDFVTPTLIGTAATLTLQKGDFANFDRLFHMVKDKPALNAVFTPEMRALNAAQTPHGVKPQSQIS